MIQYINRILPRLREYSADLDKKEIFIEKPWVIVDYDLNQQKYIFKRDGDLIMSLNGQVSIGKWEYLSAAKCLLIDRVQDKILLNQNFIDPAVMILKKDGFYDENLILVNEILLPDLNVAGYLKQLYYKKNEIHITQLINGDYLEIVDYSKTYFLNSRVTIEGEPVPDGKLELKEPAKKFLIKESKIVKVFDMVSYKTDKGLIQIEVEKSSPHVGDLVFQDENLAKDGKYRLKFLYHITVKDGRIIK
jgi:hypothetical protein